MDFKNQMVKRKTKAVNGGYFSLWAIYSQLNLLGICCRPSNRLNLEKDADMPDYKVAKSVALSQLLCCSCLTIQLVMTG